MFRRRFRDFLFYVKNFEIFVSLKTYSKVKKQLLYDIPHEFMLSQVQLFPVEMSFDLITSNYGDRMNAWKDGQLVKNFNRKALQTDFHSTKISL